MTISESELDRLRDYIWHGGECTTQGLSRFDFACRVCRRLNKSDLPYSDDDQHYEGCLWLFEFKRRREEFTKVWEGDGVIIELSPPNFVALRRLDEHNFVVIS